MPTYRQLNQKHPEYDSDYWAEIRALYSGGKRLLKDSKLMTRLFPKHNAESQDVYNERAARAQYVPYLGQILDHTLAALSSDPVQLKYDPEIADTFYALFYSDVSPQGFSKMSLNQLVRKQILTALKCKRAWTLADLPDSSKPGENGEDDAPPASLADQEARGDLRAYAIPLEPECVFDWEKKDNGDLEWVLCHSLRQRRASVSEVRHNVREEWMMYTDSEWIAYAVEYDPDKNAPKDEDEIAETGRGPHSFGRVPILCLELPDGLWAGNKIASLAAAHFNKRCALDWGEYKSLFQFLKVNLAPTDPMNEVTDDPNRAFQTVGHGRVVVLGDKDNIDFVGADAAPFEIALKDLNNLRDEMFRVLHAMAMSVDNSGAALQRSGDSKQMDMASQSIVLKALGGYAKEHAEDVVEMVMLGREGKPIANVKAVGMEEFDAMTADGVIAEAMNLENISLPSAAFQIEYKMRLALAALGANMPDDLVATIRSELEKNITNEQFQEPPPGEDPSFGDAPQKKQGE